MSLVRSAFRRMTDALTTTSRTRVGTTTPTRLPLRQNPQLILARHLHSSGALQSFHESFSPHGKKLTSDTIKTDISMLSPVAPIPTTPKTDPKKSTHQSTTTQPAPQAIDHAHASSSPRPFRKS